MPRASLCLPARLPITTVRTNERSPRAWEMGEIGKAMVLEVEALNQAQAIHGGVAQQVEHEGDALEVAGSRPAPATGYQAAGATRAAKGGGALHTPAPSGAGAYAPALSRRLQAPGRGSDIRGFEREAAGVKPARELGDRRDSTTLPANPGVSMERVGRISTLRTGSPLRESDAPSAPSDISAIPPNTAVAGVLIPMASAAAPNSAIHVEREVTGLDPASTKTANNSAGSFPRSTKENAPPQAEQLDAVRRVSKDAGIIPARRTCGI